MNFRFTLVLLVVLAVLGTAIVATGGGTPELEAPAESNHHLRVFGLEAEEVQRLEVCRGAETKLFERSGGDWLLHPAGERVNDGRVEAAVTRLASLRAMRRIEAADADLTAFGLATPKLVIQLDLANGTTQLLQVGDPTPVQTGYYARAQSGREVYVLARVLVSDLERLVDEPTPPTPTLPTNGARGTPLPGGTSTLPASPGPTLAP